MFFKIRDLRPHGPSTAISVRMNGISKEDACLGFEVLKKIPLAVRTMGRNEKEKFSMVQAEPVAAESEFSIIGFNCSG